MFLRLHVENAQPGSLAKLFLDEFSTDHKIMTAELAKFWSAAEAMIEAYSYRASPVGDCDERLGAVIVAGATAVGNTEFEEGERVDLEPWASLFSLSTDELQKMAVFSDRQQERVRSLASNMT